jgi:phospholipid/cholesterol/gamma-HCH transport system ATP-binding protein
MKKALNCEDESGWTKSAVGPTQAVHTQTPLVGVRGLRKSFGDHHVLSGVDFEVEKGGIVSVLGRSGTGKSVLLKCVVGLLQFDSGEILYEGELLASKARWTKLRERSSYVFQHNALFDSSTVLENTLIPLRALGKGSPDEWHDRAQTVLDRLELLGSADRYPEELSGGMQKRLAVARALVTDPEIVFFDEPTAGLDPIRRNAVFEMISQLQRERQFTAVIVTHDVQEALIVSSRIIWLDQGKVRFLGSSEAFSISQQPDICKFRDNIDALRASLMY